MSLERDSVMAVLHSKRVWLVHVIANALLFAAFFYWLQIRDESGAWFALSVVGGIVIAFCVLLLHSATLSYFHEGTESSFVSALKRAIPRVPAFLLWTIIFGVVLWFLGQLWDYSAQAGNWTRHLLPEFLRRSVSARSSISAASAVVWFLFFFVWPILFLPVGVQAAVKGVRGVFRKRRWIPSRELHYWIVYAVCFLVGAYVPYKLAWMTPEYPSPLSAQTWSMVARLGLGYLLLVTAWLVLCAAMARVTADPKAAAANG